MGAKKNLAEKVLAALNISVEGTIVKNFVNQTVNGVLTTLVVLMVALNFAKKHGRPYTADMVRLNLATAK